MFHNHAYKAETFYKESVALLQRTCPWLFHQLSSKTYLTSLAYQTIPIRPEYYSNVCKRNSLAEST